MSRVRAAAAFATVVLRLLLRDRTALFFILVLPVIVIVIVGTTFGGQGDLELGVVVEEPGDVAEAVVAALERADGVSVERHDDLEAAREAVRRYDLEAALVLPASIGEELAGGSAAEVGLVVLAAGDGGFAARTAVQGALDEVGASVAAAQLLVERRGGRLEDRLADVEPLAGEPPVTVRLVDVGASADQELSQFSLTAPQNLVLFTFINAMSAATLLVVARRDGILHRSLAAPVGVGTVLVGLGGGWYLLSLVQSLLILGVGALGFGVDWGDPVAAGLLVLVFAAVGCGAGLLVGAVGRDEDRVGSFSPPIGIVLGALGGCMMPLEFFGEPMRTIAHAVPHYWAMTAWQQLVFDGDGLGDIAGALAVLTAMATVLLALATWLLRRDLTGARRTVVTPAEASGDDEVADVGRVPAPG